MFVDDVVFVVDSVVASKVVDLVRRLAVIQNGVSLAVVGLRVVSEINSGHSDDSVDSSDSAFTFATSASNKQPTTTRRKANPKTRKFCLFIFEIL